MRSNSFNSLLPFINNVGGFIDEIIQKSMQDFSGGQLFQVNIPAVNVIEKDNQIELHLAAPGLQKSDFNIKLEDRKLIISAETKNETEEQNENFTRREFDFRSFKRTYQLHENLDDQNISAKYENGILLVSIPKIEKVQNNAKSIVIE